MAVDVAFVVVGAGATVAVPLTAADSFGAIAADFGVDDNRAMTPRGGAGLIVGEETTAPDVGAAATGPVVRPLVVSSELGTARSRQPDPVMAANRRNKTPSLDRRRMRLMTVLP